MLIRADSLIPIDSQKVGKPLPLVEAWLNSTHIMLVFPDAAFGKVGVKVGDAEAKAYQPTEWGVYHPQMNYWYFYLPKSLFVAAGETAYKVVAEDLEGNRHVCGEGVLRVYSGMIDDPADEAGNKDATSVAYVSCDGVWYALNVADDESGSLHITLQTQVGAPASEVSGTPYAYCRRTGLFHAVTAFKDEAGKVALQVEENGVEGDLASFAYDPATGLYYRVEVETDESGVSALELGEGQ